MDMEQQYRQTPPMTPEDYGKRIWYLWGPIILKAAIGIGVSMIAMGVLTMMYMMMNQDLAMTVMQNEEEMLKLYDKILGQYIGAAAVIEGVAAVITIPVMLFFFHRDRVKEKQMGVIPNRKAPLWKYGAGLLMALALCLGLNNLIAIGNLSKVSESYEATIEAFYSAPLAAQVIALGILTPLCEELVYRGLLFRRLRERGTFLQAALYSSVVFGFTHMNLVQMFYGIFTGMMLAYLYEKYGSVKAPVAAHMAMNLLSILGTEYHLLDWLLEDSMRIGIVTVVCAFVASAMFVLVQRIDERPEGPDTTENLASA